MHRVRRMASALTLGLVMAGGGLALAAHVGDAEVDYHIRSLVRAEHEESEWPMVVKKLRLEIRELLAERTMLTAESRSATTDHEQTATMLKRNNLTLP